MCGIGTPSGGLSINDCLKGMFKTLPKTKACLEKSRLLAEAISSLYRPENFPPICHDWLWA
jgi:hypothetical protein